MNALIFENGLLQIVEHPFPVHPSMEWVDCSDEATVEAYEYVDGEVVPKPEPPKPPKEQRIAVLQSAYEVDRDKLNRAWLSALIADGAEETARKSAIQIQMDALDAQLESDILTILTEG